MLENFDVLGLRKVIVLECVGEFGHFLVSGESLFWIVLENLDILGLRSDIVLEFERGRGPEGQLGTAGAHFQEFPEMILDF